MDLVDLIEEKHFLGQEFLLWLWYKSEERGGAVMVPELGREILVVFEKHMLLEYGEGEAHEKLVCRGLMTELKEARAGLALGKKPEQARIRFEIDNHEWSLTLKARLFEFQNVRLPKTETGSGDSDDPMEVEGRLLDQIGLYETAQRTIDQLFRAFLELRCGEQWPAELERVQQWVRKGVN
ncbi:hypothetical protein [Desulfurivibrio dismutans]|uniref:hypothetical protein n=1 Tax=Desulfurivibrio dismutans TaxID=1398908 RepID=UPI0023DAC70B|nr:hypothetical protein [Desulfurivibrio alkaliphilus]MDF1613993.1 hypothetical protein [Desulfurivibrio alkaliphilus]